MTDKNSERGNFLRFLGTDEQGFKELEAEAQPIVDRVDSTIGGKNYWQVSYDELRSMYAAVKLMEPRLVVETGVGPGTTSTAILSAMRGTEGKLISFDLGQKFGEDDEIPVGQVVPKDLRSSWELVIGDSRETLPQRIKNNAPVDIFFHDSDHTYEHVMFELETCREFASEKFLIIIDNYDWSSAPEEFARKYGLELYNIAEDMCYIFKKQ